MIEQNRRPWRSRIPSAPHLQAVGRLAQSVSASKNVAAVYNKAGDNYAAYADGEAYARCPEFMDCSAHLLLVGRSRQAGAPAASKENLGQFSSRVPPTPENTPEVQARSSALPK